MDTIRGLKIPSKAELPVKGQLGFFWLAREILINLSPSKVKPHEKVRNIKRFLILFLIYISQYSFPYAINANPTIKVWDLQ